MVAVQNADAFELVESHFAAGVVWETLVALFLTLASVYHIVPLSREGLKRAEVELSAISSELWCYAHLDIIVPISSHFAAWWWFRCETLCCVSANSRWEGFREVVLLR